MHPSRAVAVCMLAVGVVAGAAAAAPTWQPAVRLSPNDGGPSIQSPKVATNAAGTTVVVWERAASVQAISRPARSAAWSPPVDLAAGREPLVALSAAGGAVVAFTSGGFATTDAQAVSRPSATSPWEAPVTLSPRPNMAATDVAVNARGDAVVGVNGFTGQGYVAEAAYRPGGSPTWQPAVTLSDPAGNSPRGTDVAIDAAGDAVAVWVRAGPGAENPVVMASFRRASTGVWEPPVGLGGPYVDAFPQVAMGPSGNAVAAWTATRSTAGTITTSVEASFRPAGGSWSGPVTLSTPTGVVSDLDIGVDSAGNALAVWAQVRPAESAQVQAAARGARSDAWQTVDVTAPEPGGYISSLDLAFDPAGNAVAAWASGSVRAALRPAASGVWQPAADVARPAGGTFAVDVAMAGAGNALAVWPTTVTPATVEASDLEASGPLFERVEVPATATARVPVAMTAQGVPWASPLAGAPRWSFGDGASAEGTTVRHVYTAPGTYTVSVTQADAAGGTATASRTITVAAPTLANRGRPSLRGRPRVGAVLACLRGRWIGTPPIRFAYAWLRNGRRVSTGPVRRLRAADAGALVACRVRATNPAGSAVATSRALRVRG